MDDEIKGIPRRYTEDEWRELTKKKAKGIHPIVKQLALLVSVMVGVALAVSAYTGTSSEVSVSGQVAGDSGFCVYFCNGGYWQETLNIDFGNVEAGDDVTREIAVRWNDSNINTSSATLTGVNLTSANNLSFVSIESPIGTNVIGQSFDEDAVIYLWLTFHIDDNAQVGETVSGNIILEFEVS